MKVNNNSMHDLKNELYEAKKANKENYKRIDKVLDKMISNYINAVLKGNDSNERSVPRTTKRTR